MSNTNNLSLRGKIIVFFGFFAGMPTLILGWLMLALLSMSQNLSGGLTALITGIAMLVFASLVSMNKIRLIAGIGLVVCDVIVGAFCLYVFEWNSGFIETTLPLGIFLMTLTSIGIVVSFVFKKETIRPKETDIED